MDDLSSQNRNAFQSKVHRPHNVLHKKTDPENYLQLLYIWKIVVRDIKEEETYFFLI